MNERSELLNQLQIDREDRAAGSGYARLLWSAASAAIVLVGVSAWLGFASADTTTVGVVTAEAMSPGAARYRGSSLDASGYVVARRQATVSSKVTGKVVEIMIEEGQRVEQGEIVARLDDTNARAAVQQARAQLEQAKASLDAARIAYENSQPIFERSESQFVAGFISAQSFDGAKADHDQALASLEVAARAVDVADANLALSLRNLEDMTVRAPFSGVVTVKAAQEGEMVSPVSAGGGFTRTGIGTIVDMDSLEVEVDVSENFINRVVPGQDARVTLNAYPDWEIPAHVIAIIPTADRAKATVRVRVGLEVRDARVLPQMGVRVSFLEPDDAGSQEPDNPLGVLVPPDAIQSSGDTGVVYLLRDDRLERRAVRLGGLTPSGRIVLSGLTPGVRLATGKLESFSDGLKVRVQNL